jgi:hypothetical protein
MPMPPDQFREKIKTEPQASLKQRLENCRRNPKYAAYVPILKQELDSRFPGWDRPVSRRGGSRTTEARFFQESARFSTAREGYIWLVERLMHHNPTLFTDMRWETTGYVAVGRRRGPNGAARNYFAKAPQNLFISTPSLAGDHSNYCRLTNGWFLNLNLNTRENFEILCRFAAMSKLKHGEHWDWEVLDPTEELSKSRERTLLANQLMKELDALLSEASRSGA